MAERAADARRLVDEGLAAVANGDEGVLMLTAARLADREPGPDWSAAVGRTLVARLTQEITRSWRRGWQPADLMRAVRREYDGGRRADAAGDMIVAELRRYAAATVDPRWDGQLAGLGPAGWWGSDDGYPWALADRDRTDRITVVGELLEVLRLLAGLPALELLGPVPGEARPAAEPRCAPAAAADERILRRLRAMLAKAESTDYPDEAEALTARAQELMARHSIDQALLAAGTPGGGGVHPDGRRIGVNNPYESPKAVLLTVVAEANRCRAVWSRQLGFCTVLGFPGDLDAVELLFTSLLVQATTAMVAAGSKTDQRGRPRTRAFRHSFLAAYATRIGERLSQATAAATRQAAETSGTDLVPVLAARDEQVERAVTEHFPRLVNHRLRGGRDAEGWLSGRAAADLADLHRGTPVERA